MTFANIMREKGIEPSCPLWAPDPKSGTDPPRPVAQQGTSSTTLHWIARKRTRPATAHATRVRNAWVPYAIASCVLGAPVLWIVGACR